MMAKDVTAKIRAVELALARGANILDAVMSRKHNREAELDICGRDMYIQQHEVSVKVYRHFYQMLRAKEDDSDGLEEHMEQLKDQFESAMKIANFSEIGRIKELMKRVHSDLIRIPKEFQECFNFVFAWYKKCWELELVLYQRFRLAESSIGDDPNLNLELLSEEPSLVPLKFDAAMTITTWEPRPSALEPFLVMRMDANVLKNPQFKEGHTAWECNETTELSLSESVDHENMCVARCIASGQGVLVQQRIVINSEGEYFFNVRSAMSSSERVLSLSVERQDAQNSGRLHSQHRRAWRVPSDALRTVPGGRRASDGESAAQVAGTEEDSDASRPHAGCHPLCCICAEMSGLLLSGIRRVLVRIRVRRSLQHCTPFAPALHATRPSARVPLYSYCTAFAYS